jgi:hypothetical protein
MSSKGSGGNGKRLAAHEAFEILGPIRSIEPIATGSSIRDLERLRRAYGAGRWRKLKGVASIRLSSGRIRLAELHWYEAHGIGKKEIKRKRYLQSGSEL